MEIASQSTEMEEVQCPGTIGLRASSENIPKSSSLQSTSKEFSTAQGSPS